MSIESDDLYPTTIEEIIAVIVDADAKLVLDVWRAVHAYPGEDTPIVDSYETPVSVICTGDFPEDNIIETFREQHRELAEYLVAVQPDRIRVLIREASATALFREQRDQKDVTIRSLEEEIGRLSEQVTELTKERNEAVNEALRVGSKYQALLWDRAQGQVPEVEGIQRRELSDVTITLSDPNAPATTSWTTEDLLNRAENEAVLYGDDGDMRLFPKWAVAFACKEIESMEWTRVRQAQRIAELMTDLAATRHTISFLEDEARGREDKLLVMKGEFDKDRTTFSKTIERVEIERDSSRMDVDQLTSRIAELNKAREADRVQIQMLQERFDSKCFELISVRGENEALLAAVAALESELHPKVIGEPKPLPIEPWGLDSIGLIEVVNPDPTEGSTPVPPWPAAFPMKLITDRAAPEGEVLMVTDEQVAEAARQAVAEDMERTAVHVERSNDDPKGPLTRDPAVIGADDEFVIQEGVYAFGERPRVRYEHVIPGWLPEAEFRKKVDEMGLKGWKIVSHTMDLSDHTHYVVFGRQA